MKLWICLLRGKFEEKLWSLIYFVQFWPYPKLCLIQVAYLDKRHILFLIYVSCLIFILSRDVFQHLIGEMENAYIANNFMRLKNKHIYVDKWYTIGLFESSVSVSRQICYFLEIKIKSVFLTKSGFTMIKNT